MGIPASGLWRKYQLWFRGIVTMKGKRYEIDEKEPRVMLGSGSLHTNGAYPSLVGKGDAVHKVKVGYQSLHRLIHELAKHGEKKDHDEEDKDEKEKQLITSSHREAIAAILVMCFEAPRLKEVRDLCSRLLKQMLDGEVGGDNKILINTWSNKSRDFYRANGDRYDITITAGTPEEIKFVYNGITILCRSPWDRQVEDKAKKHVGEEPATNQQQRSALSEHCICLRY
ncbi:unnamed protein product [Urochloa humidicola]